MNKLIKEKGMVTTTITITRKQHKFIKEHYICLSKFIQEKLDQHIKTKDES